jgi:hypothetical protein
MNEKFTVYNVNMVTGLSDLLTRSWSPSEGPDPTAPLGAIFSDAVDDLRTIHVHSDCVHQFLIEANGFIFLLLQLIFVATANFYYLS